MYANKIPATLLHAFRSARPTSAFVAMSALLLAACAVDTPTGLRSPPGSRLLGASSASTLGRASSFAALGASTVTCTAAGTNTGDVGVSPGSSITGFNPDCTLTGTLHAANDASAAAQADAATAYGSLSAAPCDVTYGAVQELAGLTLNPGVHCFPSSAQVTAGTLTLDGPGRYTFKIASTFTTFVGSSVILTGGATCDDIFWLVGSSSTLGGPVAGSILAYTSIALDPGATLSGSAIALNGAVTMASHNRVSVCG